MFEKFLSPFGRLSRGGYWLWGVFVFGLVLTGAAMVADNFILGIDWMQSDIDKQYLKVTNLNSFQNVVFWLTLWPTTALAVKRLHDVGTTGWWYVGLYVISFVVWDLAAISGTQNENSFLSEIAPVSSFLSPEFFGEYVASVPAVVWIGVMLMLGVAWLAVIVLILFIRGNRGPNKYGDDPLAGKPHGLAKDETSPPPWLD